MHGLGSRLHNKQLAGQAIFGPLNIHRRGLTMPGRVVVFDGDGPACQLQHLFIGQTEARPVFVEVWAGS